MKIRFLLHDVYGQAGGVLTVTLALARDLARRHDVEVVNFLRHRDQSAHTLPENVPVRTIVDERRDSPRPGGIRGRLRTWANARPSRLMVPAEPRYKSQSLYTDVQLVRYIRSVRDGVLVGMQPGLNAAIARFGRSSAVRVAQEHRPFVSRHETMRAQSLRWYPRLDTFLTLTERDADRYREHIGDRVPIVAIPNASPAYSGTPSDQQSKVVVAAGRLKRSKGYDRLLEAWVSVAKRNPDWQLRIFGEGDQRTALEEQIADLGIGGSARLMGYTTSMMEEMAAASIFCLSSRAEGYPMVMLEAMSCGLPVVSFDCPTGPREIITPDHDGFLVRNGDVEGLADALNRMIDLGDRRLTMSRAALETARGRTQEAISARWEELLQGLLEKKGGAR